MNVSYEPAWSLTRIELRHGADDGFLFGRLALPQDETPLDPSSTTVAVILAPSSVAVRVTLFVDGLDARGVIASGSVLVDLPARGFVEADVTLQRIGCDDATDQGAHGICDDGNDCTNDICVDGRCSHEPSSTCECTRDSDCSDGDSCTDDACTPSGCLYTNNFTCSCTEDAECDDGLWCNGFETCDSTSKTCAPGETPDCGEISDACNVGTCDEEEDRCVSQARQDGTICDDGNACTRNDSCMQGSCGGEAIVCEPFNECHDAGECDPSTGICSIATKQDQSPCSDDNDTCTADVCISGQCTHKSTGTCECAVSDDCDDGLWCNGQETCHLDSRTCFSGAAPDCTGFANACNVGVCNEEVDACVSQPYPNGAGCDDGDLCTAVDTCQNGLCVGGQPVQCAPLNECHDAGVCSPQTGDCSNPTKSNGAPCSSDGDPCTTDHCISGACVHDGTCTCSDGIKNQGEDDVDCGGPCPPCGAGNCTASITYVENGGSDYGLCEGDCDDDGDCQRGLECFQSSDPNEEIPGCLGVTPEGNYDFCYDPSADMCSGNCTVSLTYVENGGSDYGLCEGDCDDDSDCQKGLECFQSGQSGNSIPGCLGVTSSGNDYCYDPDASDCGG